MAVQDTYKVSVVSRLDSVVLMNSFYHQQIVDGAGVDVTDLLDWYESAAFIDPYTSFQSSSVAIECITARRLAPAMTFNQTRFVSENGQLGADCLSTTVFLQMNYWVSPMGQGDRNHWKFFGIPDSAQEAGLIDNNYRTVLDDWITLVTGGTFTQNGSEFSWIRSRKSTDPIPGVLPQIATAWPKPQLSNFRGRQLRLCTG